MTYIYLSAVLREGADQEPQISSDLQPSSATFLLWKPYPRSLPSWVGKYRFQTVYGRVRPPFAPGGAGKTFQTDLNRREAKRRSALEKLKENKSTFTLREYAPPPLRLLSQ